MHKGVNRAQIVQCPLRNTFVSQIQSYLIIPTNFYMVRQIIFATQQKIFKTVRKLTLKPKILPAKSEKVTFLLFSSICPYFKEIFMCFKIAFIQDIFMTCVIDKCFFYFPFCYFIPKIFFFDIGQIFFDYYSRSFFSSPP